MTEKTGTKNTSVDLGEDLISYSDLNALAPSPHDDDPFASACILIAEGFLEDAKAKLHQVLIHQPHHAQAKVKLKEIQDIELKKIFKFEAGEEAQALQFNTREIISELDQDLNLGLALDQGLFERSEVFNEFTFRLDRALIGTSPRQRLDLGIGFIEMSLYELAIKNFKAASQEPSQFLVASALGAYAQILSGHPFDALLELEPILKDGEIEDRSKTDLMYLMGRALESLGKLPEAAQWFEAALEQEPDYRDAEMRLERANR